MIVINNLLLKIYIKTFICAARNALTVHVLAEASCIMGIYDNLSSHILINPQLKNYGQKNLI